MADHDRLGGEPAHRVDVVRDDVVEPVAGDAVGALAGLLDGGRFAWPARRGRLVAGLAEEIHPGPPRIRMQPEAVDEHDRRGRGGHLLLPKRAGRSYTSARNAPMKRARRSGSWAMNAWPQPGKSATRAPAAPLGSHSLPEPIRCGLGGGRAEGFEVRLP